MKGIQKIKWSGKGKIDVSKSKPNVTLAVLPKNDIGFVVDKWLNGTTEEDKKKNVTWILQDKNRKEIRRIQKSPKEEYTLNIPNALCGPYTYYLEASFSGIIDRKNKTGLWITGTCTPRVINSKWSTTVDGADVRKKLQFKYGQLIYLSLETEGLNGSTSLTVEVYKVIEGSYITGREKDKLVATFNNVAVIDGEVNLKMGNTASWFVHAKKDEEQFYVKVKTNWGSYVSDGKSEFHARFLRIKKEQVTNAVEPSTNNTPLKIGGTETNFLNYESCGYSSIKIKNNERVKKIFNIKSSGKIDDFEVVSGTIFTQKIEILLDDKATTKGCVYKDKINFNTHKNYIFDITEYPEEGISKLNENNQLSKYSTKSENKIKIGKDVTSEKVKHMFYYDDINLKIIQNTDSSIIFLSRFIYDTKPVLAVLPYILRYFWLGEDAITCNYNIKILSCKYGSQNVKIIVFPDVRWSLRIDYKNLSSEYVKSSKEFGSTQKYKDTKAAKFKREPTKWIDVGNRKFGINLKAKFNNKPSEYQLDGNKTTSGVRNDGEEWDITQNIFDKFQQMIKPINSIKEFMEKVMDGKDNKAGNGDQPSEDNKAALNKVAKNNKRDVELEKMKHNFESNAEKLNSYTRGSKEYIEAVKQNQSLQRKMDSRAQSLGVKLMRAPISFEVYWPEFGLEFDWSRVAIKNPGHESKFNKTGVFLEGVIEAKPLIGAKIALDFLALAQRGHPLALALIAAADIAMALIGDGSKITLEFSFQGILSGKIQGFLNTETGENTFNGSKVREANKKAVSELSAEFIAKITASVKLSMSKRSIFIVVNVDLELSLEAEAKFYTKTRIDFDDKGFYFLPEFAFEGVQLKGKANIDAKVGDSSNTWISGSSKNEFIYQAIDRKEPQELGKIYFKKLD